MGQATSGNRDTDPATGERRPPQDIRDAPLYQLAMLASLSDRKGQGIFSAKFGVSLGEWRALANIVNLQPVSLADLGREMRLDKGQLSRTVQRLVERHWVVSRAAPRNRGALLLTVTPSGQEKYTALMEFTQARNDMTMAVLTPSERKTFMSCIRKLRAYMEEQYAIEADGQTRKLKNDSRTHGEGEPARRTG